MQDPRLEKLADVIVDYSVAVRKGDLVRITGSPVAAPLVAALFGKVVQAGGHPFVRMAPEECQELLLKPAAPISSRSSTRLPSRKLRRSTARSASGPSENTRSLTNTDPIAPGRSGEGPPAHPGHLLQASRQGQELRWTGTQYPDCRPTPRTPRCRLRGVRGLRLLGRACWTRPTPSPRGRSIGKAQQALVGPPEHVQGDPRQSPPRHRHPLGVKGRKWINCDGHENFPDGEVFTGPVEDASKATSASASPPCITAGRCRTCA